MMDRRFLTVAASGLLLIGMALCPGQTKAQGDTPPEGPPPGGQMGPPRMTAEDELKRLDKKLKLTDEQKQQIKPILQDRQKKMESLFSDESLSREEAHAKMKTIFAESDGKIRALLTESQQKTFDEMKKHQHGPRGGGSGGEDGPPPPPPDGN
jgi:Spy/CpxP family protein refolding chaperone